MQSVVGVSILLALLLGVGARLPALYHQEQGARLLARALLAEGRGEEGGLWLEPEPLTLPEAQSLAAQALARFEAAIAADPGNAQAHRWLGRAALLLGRPEEAVAAFSTAVRLHPASPLAWWDLGLAYERLYPTRNFPISGEVSLPAIAPDSGPVIIDRTNVTPTLIPAIAVAAPPVKTPDSFPAAGYPLPSTGYTHWLMPDAPDAWPGWWVPAEPVRRTVLLVAVPVTVTFRLPLPVTPTALLFWMGMDPLLQPSQGDGVVYRVRVEDAEVFSHTLRPEDARGWWPAQVDLTPWAGQAVRLTLALDPGPAGDTTGDWAGWGDLQVVPADSARCLMASCRERAAAAWREGGFTAQDFIQAGEAARKAQRYEEALRWYGRASMLGADLESAQWYVVFQSAQDWEALEKSILADHGWIDEETRLRAWLRWGTYLLEHQREKEAETVLERAIAICPESPTFSPLLSEIYRILGLSQWAQGKKVEAVSSLRRAVELNDKNTWAHIHYGKIIYLFDRNLATQTENEFNIALKQNPGVDIWRNLINFWRSVGESARADQLCKQATLSGLSKELGEECSNE
ncbi:MAG: tetratricopeptide repeat protein [Thermoflexales bacterium]|nr:tetratricopeptide repeat protein [Thermoflexales bacterium]